MSTGQVFRSTVVILLTLVAAFVIIRSIRIIIVLLLAIIIASALRPLVTSLTRRRVPIGIAIMLIYLVVAAIMVTLSVAVFPPIVNQVTLYFENEGRLAFRIIAAQRWMEGIISDVTNSEVSLVAPDEIRAAVSSMVGELREAMPLMLNHLSSTIGEAVLIFVMGAYWLTSHQKATEFITQLAPPRYQANVEQVIAEIETTMGAYVRGIAVISITVGLLNLIPMLILGIPNAVTIAFIIAISTTIPMIGGLLGGIMAVLITLVAATEYVFGVAAISFIVQQIEAYILGPRVMSERVGLDPLLVIVYTSVGFVMFGIVGALIAVPVMGTVHILLLHLVIEPYKNSLKQFETQDGLQVIKHEKGDFPSIAVSSKVTD